MLQSGETQLFTLQDVCSKKFLSAVDNERDEDKYVCKKGWVVANDGEGNYTPFFVYTRSKDIVWDQSGIKKMIQSFFGDEYKNIVEMKTYTPGVIEKFKYCNWDVSVDLGHRNFELKRKMNIAELFELVEDDYTDLVYEFKLPLPIISDSDFNICHTMSGNNEQLATAFVNVNVTENEYDHQIEKIELHLRNLIYYFHSNFKKLPEYKESYVYITIRGRNYYF